MLALTLWRPYSWCISHLDKRVENRDWPMPARVLGQRVAIHAGKTLSKYALAQLDEEGITLPSTFALGRARHRDALGLRGNVPADGARGDARDASPKVVVDIISGPPPNTRLVPARGRRLREKSR